VQPIIEQHRPPALDAALALLARPHPLTRPLAGGTHILKGEPRCEAFVDLADLGLGGIMRSGQGWRLGATATLDELATAEDLPPALHRAATRQASRNTRRRATLGGTIAVADSGPLLACLLALRGQVEVAPGRRTLALADYLVGSIEARRDIALILALSFNAGRCVGMAEIARTPADAPLLCVAVGAVPERGRLVHVTVAAGATGQPLALCREAADRLEGSPVEADVAFDAADETVAWQDDGRASADYRRAMLPVLVRRACAELLAACREVHHEG
jgi:CO/xanthine dehydrogenase FAD-binding subunit